VFAAAVHAPALRLRVGDDTSIEAGRDGTATVSGRAVSCASTRRTRTEIGGA
jgi:hypothetical protein